MDSFDAHKGAELRMVEKKLGPALAWGALIIAFTVTAYLPALNGGFVWDDDTYVTNNLLLTATDGLRRIWFSLDSPSQYFPLVYTTLRIERASWGLNPFGYHLVNVLLHGTNALLVWRLLGRLNVPGAWLAAGIFALHPVHVESVAWITERKNVLMGVFFFVTLLAWIEFIDNRTKRRWIFYWLALLCYALALFSKSTACTLPAALLLILWFRKDPIDWRRLAQIVPFLLFAVIMGLIAVYWERYHQGTHGALGPLERLLIASHAVWFYAGKLIWPTTLTFIYPRWNVVPTNPWSYAWLLAGIGFCVAIYFVRAWTGRGVEVAIAFFVMTLSPMIGFIMLYTFRYTFVADHYQYVASVGLIALLAAAASRFATALNRSTQFSFSVGLLLFLGTLTFRQAGAYHDLETLWRDTLNKNPGCWMAYNNLANVVLQNGRTNEAISDCQQALALKSDYPEAHLTLGVALLQSGKTSDAILQLEEAHKLEPDWPEVHFNLGVALVVAGSLDEAIRHFDEALRLDPNFIPALEALAWIRCTQSDTKWRSADEALRLAERAAQLTGYNDAKSLDVLAAAKAEAGEFNEAIEQGEKARRLASGANKTELANEIASRLDLYRLRLPYRMRH
jgi:protein O-mannosyl-transferase